MRVRDDIEEVVFFLSAGLCLVTWGEHQTELANQPAVDWVNTTGAHQNSGTAYIFSCYCNHVCLCVLWMTTHRTVSASSASKLQLSKGVSGTLGSVLHTVPLSDNSCSKEVLCSHRVMQLPHPTTLTLLSITVEQNTNPNQCVMYVSNALSY